jgi:putative exosortase-associated protein (TIGR04073 family)
MKTLFLAVAILITSFVTVPAFASEIPKPESIAEKMSFKLVRGATNFFTSIVELPKQTILTGRNHGTVGYVVGPIKGVGMTFYRAFIGLTEVVFFLVPQPGYYDPMMEPDFVWQGWDGQRAELPPQNEEVRSAEAQTEQKAGGK